jgi:hypothetical protein
MKTDGGVGWKYSFIIFLTSALDGSEWSASRLDRFKLWEIATDTIG